MTPRQIETLYLLNAGAAPPLLPPPAGHGPPPGIPPFAGPVARPKGPGGPGGPAAPRRRHSLLAHGQAGGPSGRRGNAMRVAAAAVVSESPGGWRQTSSRPGPCTGPSDRRRPARHCPSSSLRGTTLGHA